MWKEILESKIIRVEGLSSADLVTNVFISKEESQVLDPYNQDKAFQLPLKTGVQIVIKSKTFNEKYSVSFNTSLIVEDGVHWLPLFREAHSDSLVAFPDEVLSPRVLVLLHKKISLDIIHEGGERSEVGSNCEEDYMPEIKLCSSFIEHNLDDPFEESYEEQNEVLPDIKVQVVDEVNQELKAKLEKAGKLLEIEKKISEGMAKELETVKTAFEAELQEARKRENEILEEFRSAEAKYAASKFELTRLKHEIKSLQSENVRLGSCIQHMEQSNMQQMEDLNKKLAVYEQNHSNSDNILTKLAEFTGSNEMLREKEEVIQKLNEEISALRSKSGALSKSSLKVDELEEAVQKFIKKFKVSTPIVKDKEQVYIFGNKKISLCVKDGVVLYRVGAVLKPLEEILSFQINDSKAKSREEDLRNRASPIRKSVKGLHSGSKSPRRSSYT